MHRENYTLDQRTAYKKGFALILTLSALTVIIALTAVLISYLDEARKESTVSKALIQANLYYADIKEIFKTFKKRKSLYTVLYQTPVPFATEDGRFSITLQCEPLAGAVNINWLASGEEQNMSLQFKAAQKVFDVIVQSYDLQDASKLEEMLLLEIGKGKPFVQRKQSRLQQKNGIMSYKQFADILDRYQREADDNNIKKVPWKHYFTFIEVSKYPEENLIDGDYASVELIAVLLDIDMETVQESWVKGSELKSFAQEMGASYDKKLFAKEFVAKSRCEVQFEFEGEHFRFAFEDIDKEIKNFEFFGKQ